MTGRKVDDVDRVMAANSNNQNNPKNRNRENKVGNGSETLRVENSGEEEEEDDMDIGWTQIEGRYGKKASRKRKKVPALQVEMGEMPIQLRRKQLILTYWARTKGQEVNHPVKTLMEDLSCRWRS
ncbi:uncharacterized protein [Danio rerio]|uniref:Uncharacterized protein n=1 Tax=Danio rerio TaxID=7955 RepID=A0AC58HRK0_DANRE